MIQIDDSGWGSLLGSVMIGMYDTQSRVFACGSIPIRYFQGTLYSKSKYREQATKVALKLIQKKFHLRGQDIQICRGTCLDNIFDTILACSSGYQFRSLVRVEIGDPLQKTLEAAFAKSLVKVGVPQKSSGAHCLSFDEQLEWIKEDPSNRIKHVKTGWNSWKNKYSKSIKI
jgi:hypothetical protein